MSPDTISEPLPNNTTKRRLSATHVVDAQRHPVIVAEIEFRQIPVQVLLAGVLVNALHSTLEDAEIALNRVGVDRAVIRVNVFLLAVAHDAMPREVLVKIVVVAAFVVHDAGFLGDVCLKDRHDGRWLQIVHSHRTRLTAGSIQQAQHFHLVVIGATISRVRTRRRSASSARLKEVMDKAGVKGAPQIWFTTRAVK
jgi:hypothetical protein